MKCCSVTVLIALVLTVSSAQAAVSIGSMNPDGSGQLLISQDPGAPTGLNWSPDRTKIVYTSNSTGYHEVYEYSICSDQLCQLTNYNDSYGQWGGRYIDNDHIWYRYVGGGGAQFEYREMAKSGCSVISDTTLFRYTGWSLTIFDLTLSHIYFAVQTGGNGNTEEIFRAPIGDVANYTQLTNNYVPDRSPDVSLDETKVVFLQSLGAGLTNNVFIMNIDGTNLQQLTFEPSYPIHSKRIVYPHWSDDMTQIAYSFWDGSQWDIYILPADGSGSPQNITNTPTESEQVWDWRGGRMLFTTTGTISGGSGGLTVNIDNAIAYASKESGTWEIWAFDPNTNDNQRIVTVGGTSVWGGEWSPSRTKIAFSSDMSGVYELYVVNSDGSGLQRVTCDGYGFGNVIPRWENDTTLVYTANKYSSAQFEMCRLVIGSTTPEILTNSGGTVSGFSYSFGGLSSDETRITYAKGIPYYAASSRVYVADWPGLGNEIQIASINGGHPRWGSNDIITFYHHSGSVFDVYTVASDGANLTNLSSIAGVGYSAMPSFSESGSHIAFHTLGAGTGIIGIMNSDGSNYKEALSISGGSNLYLIDWGGALIDTTAVVATLDIKPRHCPNEIEIGDHHDDGSKQDGTPAGFAAKGDDGHGHKHKKLKVAIVGTSSFDVSNVNVPTVMLEGVAPSKSKIKDKTQPVTDTTACACTRAGKDGIDDLELKFDQSAILATLGTVQDGDVFELTLTGELNDGTAFEGSDCIVIRFDDDDDDDGDEDTPDGGTSIALASSNIELGNYPNPFNPATEISFSLPSAGHVQLAVYNIAGQQVALLADDEYAAGRHTVTWDASDKASGIYFYRLQTEDAVESRKMLLLK